MEYYVYVYVYVNVNMYTYYVNQINCTVLVELHRKKLSNWILFTAWFNGYEDAMLSETFTPNHVSSHAASRSHTNNSTIVEWM